MSAPDLDTVAAPSRPPPLLTEAQLQQICRQGYLDLDLASTAVYKDLDGLFANSSTFLDLPTERKAQLYPSIPGDTEHGYSHIPDEKEFLTLRYRPSAQCTEKPSDEEERVCADLEGLMERVWNDLARLLHRMLHDISAYLGSIDPSAWDPLISESLQLPSSREAATPTLLRVFRYYAERGVAEPHRDLGLLTVCVTRGKGLQLWDRLGPPSPKEEADRSRPSQDRWRDAGEITVMVGDTLRVLSGNRVPAAAHRVIATDKGRSSIVFALRSSLRSTIDLEDFGGYGQVKARVLWNEIRKSRVNVNAQRDAREEQIAKNRKGASIA
ncbi:hypothetical protein QBC46DRAFT_69450 [Diplogelasinospora grovesii]|uniref:Fe2OG dioxygenase domain-containing protein n=1 Tax=Diplogelasinospora grovesii TaxID=303347 RepID=A0AAN6NBD2_9PEZI|nr:hypothetical protein QBC46DRAFT_69450 [Diplogelasinospora grovesii]